MATKWTRKEKGLYMSHDGRWTIRDGYDPSGAPWVREGRASYNRWRLADGGKVAYRDATLAGCREFVEWLLGLEAKREA